MGFISPSNRQEFFVGVNKNIQLNLPIRAEIDVDIVNSKVAVKVQPLDQHNKQNIFEYSTVPYTTKQNIIQAVQNPNEAINEAHNSNRKIVHARQPRQVME